MLASGRKLIDPETVLTQAGISEGMVVIDLGCGSIGHFVFPVAHRVGENGQVYAVDIQKKALEILESRRKLEHGGHPDRIELVWGDIEKMNGVDLPDSSSDVTIISNNISIAKDLKTLVKEAIRLTKPEGKVVVVDWKKRETPLGPELKERVSEKEATYLFGSLIHEKAFEAGPYHYGIIFKKPTL